MSRWAALAAGLLATLIAPTPAREATARWAPAPGATWQWQLTVPVDLSVEADVYDIDGFDNSARVVAELHARGRRAICYIDAGAYEDYRSDASRFPESVLGKPNPLWPGERWLDIRRLDVLGPIMEARLDMCRRKGFDGVELDEIDGWSNDTGFPLTAPDQLRYNRFLAREVRERGMAILLSSHLLNQVQSVCDRIGIFASGRLIGQGTMEQLAARFGDLHLYGVLPRGEARCFNLVKIDFRD